MEDGYKEFEKWSEWVSDENFMLSPDFVPTKETPQGAIDYYKSMMDMVVDFDAPDFSWPTSVGMNC